MTRTRGLTEHASLSHWREPERAEPGLKIKLYNLWLSYVLGSEKTVILTELEQVLFYTGPAIYGTSHLTLQQSSQFIYVTGFSFTPLFQSAICPVD